MTTKRRCEILRCAQDDNERSHRKSGEALRYKFDRRWFALVIVGIELRDASLLRMTMKEAAELRKDRKALRQEQQASAAKAAFMLPGVRHG